VATDNRGLATTSSAVSITVNSPNVPPSVALTAPANGAVFTAPSSFQLAAAASDSDGTVTKVEFFQDTTKLGEIAFLVLVHRLAHELPRPRGAGHERGGHDQRERSDRQHAEHRARHERVVHPDHEQEHHAALR
jgi:hypothetical protein